MASLFFVLFTLVLLSFGKICISQQEAREDNWLSFQTAYLTVDYKPEVNLKRVLGRLSGRELSSHSKLPAYTLTGIEAKVAYRLDVIFMRVRDILGMYPDKAEIKIKIYKNRQDIKAELCYLNQADEACKSFYIYNANTIYASEQDLTDSIIAHEMAHAVVDNYFSTIPPKNMAEILATNVDLRLDD